MKVTAKHWLNYNGVWYKGGDTFEADDFDEIKEHAEKVEEAVEETVEETQYVSEIFPPVEQPKRRGRPKKSED